MFKFKKNIRLMIKKKSNDEDFKNLSWRTAKKFDGIGKSHRNKLLKKNIETPHIHEDCCPGGTRPAEDWEIPK